MPLKRGCDGRFKIEPGMELLVGLSTDFFVEEADAWRDEAWDAAVQTSPCGRVALRRTDCLADGRVPRNLRHMRLSPHLQRLQQLRSLRKLNPIRPFGVCLNVISPKVQHFCYTIGMATHEKIYEQAAD